MMDALSPEQQMAALDDLPGWTYDAARKALFRNITLADFSAAFALMTRIALAAEQQDHHPEWSNVYNRIDIWLTTHDAGGVSARDVKMAQTIEAFL
ncbi:4a-hydroxytetrahydrobiopterin dehydratase [Sphingobium boeckii]|uniref:Putative pterin-4-alpha-carbinolamine dehydratase n=1 Tax=Sphingobium boeckii TaxID=1082345 RepID=A0A7W9AFX7_9SPHN|nr:4a-hydroxytetrahydrobiopterin dehydratase [Sphingobium boeckii]MBB5684792.1 4a-hydroxytetrahydrobiopterin dehydratase [Sphingobium boeckii]